MMTLTNKLTNQIKHGKLNNVGIKQIEKKTLSWRYKKPERLMANKADTEVQKLVFSFL